MWIPNQMVFLDQAPFYFTLRSFTVCVLSQLSVFGQDNFHVSEAHGRATCPMLLSDVAR